MNRTPDLIADLRQEINAASVAELPAIIGQLEALKSDLFVRMIQGAREEATLQPEGDTLVDVYAAAQIVRMGVGWVRRHQNELPRVPLPGRAVRFSAKRLETWVRRRGERA